MVVGCFVFGEKVRIRSLISFLFFIWIVSILFLVVFVLIYCCMFLWLFISCNGLGRCLRIVGVRIFFSLLISVLCLISEF